MRVICIGAHPDDCEIEFGGTAAKLAAAGHNVKFLSVTNGAAGHFSDSGPSLADRRRREAQEAAARLGIDSTEVLSNQDAQLVPALESRWEIVRHIRLWRADIVLTHRPWDYHPDHRYASQLVQDSAYLVVVPSICPDTPWLRENPVFLYLEDRFHWPAPFAPDLAVDIDDVWERKMDALDAHASQVYEWLPWVDGHLNDVPQSAGARRDWLSRRWSRELNPCTRAALARRYGSTRNIERAEAFQVCEYGRRASAEELDEIFPR